MYYITDRGNELVIHEAASGAPHFTVWINHDGKAISYNLSGTTLSVSYSNGMTEVFDVHNRNRIR
jgi:hypothetical protein